MQNLLFSFTFNFTLHSFVLLVGLETITHNISFYHVYLYIPAASLFNLLTIAASQVIACCKKYKTSKKEKKASIAAAKLKEDQM